VGVAAAAPGEAVERLAKDLAMHVAAADPSPVAVDKSGVSDELLDSERAIYRRQAEQEGKPAKVIDRIVDGKVARFLAEVVLLEQAFVKDPDQTVGGLLRGAAGEAGTEISVTGFHRFKLGEAGEA
jgi:elongation factor Ts